MKKFLALLIVATYFSAHCMKLETIKKGRYNLRATKRRKAESDAQPIQEKIKKPRYAKRKNKKGKSGYPCRYAKQTTEPKSLTSYLDKDKFDWSRVTSDSLNLSGMELEHFADARKAIPQIQIHVTNEIIERKESLHNLIMDPMRLPLFVKFLDISHNELTILPIYLLQTWLPHLEEINAQHNKITTLNCDGINKNALTIDVRHNPELSIEEVKKALKASKPTIFEKFRPYWEEYCSPKLVRGLIPIGVNLSILASSAHGDYAVVTGDPTALIAKTTLALATGFFALGGRQHDSESIQTPENLKLYRRTGDWTILHDHDSENQSSDEKPTE